MVAEGPEIEDSRCRLIVELAAAPTPALRSALADLAADDRLAGILADPDLAELAMALPTALLVHDEAAPADGIAGVLVDAREHGDVVLREARRAWGGDAILLAAVGTSRHAAMEAGEFGADALLFTGEAEAVHDCVRWWSELFVLPIAAPAEPDEVAALIGAGADFLVIDGDRLVDGSLPARTLGAAMADAESRRPAPPPNAGPAR